MELPTCSVLAPVIIPASGNAFMVIAVFVRALQPNEFVTVYITESVPAKSPVMMPVVPVPGTALRWPASLPQVPPETEAVYVTDEPTQTADAPEIVPAAGTGFTVMD
jgi:hypothetical protein